MLYFIIIVVTNIYFILKYNFGLKISNYFIKYLKGKSLTLVKKNNEHIKQNFLKFERLYNKHIKLIILFLEIIILFIISNYLNRALNFDNNYITTGEIGKININLQTSGNNDLINFIKKFFNYDKSLEIFLGLVSIIAAIYIYCISIADSIKRHILMLLIGNENVLFGVLTILLFYFINISPLLFIGLVLVLFYQLYQIIKSMFLILSSFSLNKEFIKEIEEKFNKNSLINLYNEVQKELYGALINKNIVVLNELSEYYLELIQYSCIKELKVEKFKEPFQILKEKNNITEESYYFVYSIFNYLLNNPDNSVYEEISYLNIKIGNSFINNKEPNYEKASLFYRLILMKYRYYLVNKDKKFSDNLKSYIYLGFVFYEDFFDEKRDIRIDIAFYQALMDLFIEVISENEVQDFDEFVNRTIFNYKNNLNYNKADQRNEINEYIIILLVYVLKEKGKQEQFKNSYERLLRKVKLIPIGKLEVLFNLNLEYSLEDKFRVSWFFYGDYDAERKGVVDELLKLINEKGQGLSKEFILKNYKKLRYRSESMKLSKIISRLDDLKNEIGLLEVKEISKEKAIVKETFYKEINENDLQLMSQLKTKLNFKIEKDYLSKELWDENKKGIKDAFRNKRINNLSLLPLINDLSENLFLDQLTKKVKGIKNIDNLKEWILLLTFEDYCMLDDKLFFKDKIMDWDKKLSVIQINNIYLKRSIMVKKDTIDSVVYLLPENTENLKYTYVDIYSFEKDKQLDYIKEGNTTEEKELISKGYSWIEMYQVMKIILNNNEIYEIQNLDEISKETIESLN